VRLSPHARSSLRPPSLSPEAPTTRRTRASRLPTADDIAAEVRSRPIGAVIADICRDLGIAPGDLDGAFWDELNLAIISYGGTIAGIIGNQVDRSFAFTFGDRADTADPGPPPAPSRLLPSTGPP
jgi:hypothetical protein